MDYRWGPSTLTADCDFSDFCFLMCAEAIVELTNSPQVPWPLKIIVSTRRGANNNLSPYPIYKLMKTLT